MIIWDRKGLGLLRNLGVGLVGALVHIEQLFNTITSDRCDNAKLCKMGTERIDH